MGGMEVIKRTLKESQEDNGRTLEKAGIDRKLYGYVTDEILNRVVDEQHGTYVPFVELRACIRDDGVYETRRASFGGKLATLAYLKNGVKSKRTFATIAESEDNIAVFYSILVEGSGLNEEGEIDESKIIYSID
jgi:hypothetical protein